MLEKIIRKIETLLLRCIFKDSVLISQKDFEFLWTTARPLIEPEKQKKILEKIGGNLPRVLANSQSEKNISAPIFSGKKSLQQTSGDPFDHLSGYGLDSILSPMRERYNFMLQPGYFHDHPVVLWNLYQMIERGWQKLSGSVPPHQIEATKEQVERNLNMKEIMLAVEETDPKLFSVRKFLSQVEKIAQKKLQKSRGAILLWKSFPREGELISALIQLFEEARANGAQQADLTRCFSKISFGGKKIFCPSPGELFSASCHSIHGGKPLQKENLKIRKVISPGILGRQGVIEKKCVVEVLAM